MAEEISREGREGGSVESGARHLYLRIIDSGIPEAMRAGDANTLRRARIILGFTLVLILLGLEAAAFFSWALTGDAAIRVEASLIAALLLTLAIPSAFRRTGSLELGANLVLAGSFLVIVVIFSVSGGIETDLLHWVGVLPMLAALMGARRSAWYWALIGIGTIGFFVYADTIGWHFTDALILKSRSASMWMQRGIDVGSWLAILLAIALLYEGHTEQQTVQLGVQNANLVSEIAQRNRAEERTLYLAHYDELTGLPNRRFLRQQLGLAIDRAKRNDREIAILYLDLDGFKEVNDSLGHALGDDLLCEVSQRLQSCVRLGDSIARGPDEEPKPVSRLGGDEFTILLEGLQHHREAAIVAGRVLNALGEPVMLDDEEVYISVSIGIAMSRGSDDLDKLLRNADRAMYHAKKKGKDNFQFFQASMNADTTKRNQTVSDLRRAIDCDEFVLHFQPIVNCGAHEITGVEALVRWQHPTRGLLQPGEFIQVAEDTGFVVRLGEWVLREACRNYAKWQAMGIAPARMSVNVSSVQFRKGSLSTTVLEALRESGVDPRSLELEITENAMMTDEEEASRCLSELKQLGVRIALDDFGTGYSSLSYVKRFPVDSLKIDRSFVGDLENDPEAQAIPMAIIAMAHQLQLRVVAEGVETSAQEHFLETRGCDELQGYLFSRPVDADQILTLLTVGSIDGHE
jgi:diguanylate cyclase (GGDEF)-like protein